MKRFALLCLLVLTACSTGPISSADVPPAGTIWFGASFDPATLAITGKTASVTAGSSVVMVANVGKSVTVKDLKLRTSVDGKTLFTQKIKSSTKGAIFGLSFNGMGMAGKWRYELIDKGGKVLASGTITAT